MAENQQMALLLHQKNTTIDILEEKYDYKVQEEEEILREVELEKTRFIDDIIRHKEETDRHVKSLQEALSKAEDEKLQMELSWNRNKLNER